MMKQTILFDLDDTLIHCNKFFDLVIEQFADQMETMFHGYQLSGEEIKKKQSEIDLERVMVSGFEPDHFPHSFVDTYDYYTDLTGRIRDQDEVEFLLDLGASVYGHGIEPYPSMEETLRQLQADGHELHLYTGGDPSIQLRKVTEAGLEEYFDDRIHVTRHKNSEYLDGIIRAYRFDRKSTWMIGNSLRTDIIPALNCGIHAIYMPAQLEWAYNQVEVDVEPSGAFLTLDHLKQIPPSIRAYTSGSDVAMK